MWMKHRFHGFTHATGSDIENLKKSGWEQDLERFDENGNQRMKTPWKDEEPKKRTYNKRSMK